MINRRDLLRSSLSGFVCWIGVRANVAALQLPALGSPGEVERRVYSLIAEQLGLSREEIARGAHLVDDLCADSLDVVEIVMAVEEEFDVEIPDAEAERLLTVEDILHYLLGDACNHDSPWPVDDSPLEVREAQFSDLPALAEIARESWRASHREALPEATLDQGDSRFFRNRWARLLEESQAGGVSCPVLSRTRCIFGVGACGPYRVDQQSPSEEVAALLSAHRYGEIYHGYVRSSPRMRHHAELLFEVCTAHLRSSGFERAGLWTNSANLGLVDFAASMGGTRVASRPAVILDRVVSDQRDLLFAFDLDRAAAAAAGSGAISGR